MQPTLVNNGSRATLTRRKVVERVEAFLHSHLAESLPLAQLCDVAGVSERSLRNAFYDVRGMSPKRFVLKERLNEVRRALRDADATHGTVTTIATDYGFFELGRFAGTYKAVFGETPSETLRSSTVREMATAS
jgi:AraC family ethanolamine operon transcriptional activator